ncbi:MAG TPA: flavodoxin family protein [Dehalococcoidales bacterium]|nr:flavodoxin family protein [Dehalococcoidales bacterium]
MKALIIFDSVYGNTEKIARAIASGMSAKAVRPEEVKPEDMQGLNILVVGSPTHGGRATPELQKVLNDIPANGLKNVKVTAFDTRISGKDRGFGVRMITKAFGYAAGRIAKMLEEKGGTVVLEPQGFIVDNNEGPLKAGEIERATDWGKEIAAK